MVAKKKALKADVVKSRPKGSVKASAFLEKLVGKPSLGRLLRSIREGEDASLAAFAKQLGIARTNLSDIELGRRGVSVDRAAAWARLLGYHEGQFVKLALQAQLDMAGINVVWHVPDECAILIYKYTCCPYGHDVSLIGNTMTSGITVSSGCVSTKCTVSATCLGS